MKHNLILSIHIGMTSKHTLASRLRKGERPRRTKLVPVHDVIRYCSKECPEQN